MSVQIESYELFWKSLFTNWNEYYEILYNIFINASEEQFMRAGEILKLILKRINKLLPEDLARYIDIVITFGEKNNISIKEFSDIAELYISPKLDKNNITILDNLYKAYFNYKEKYTYLTKYADKLFIVKFRPYHKSNTKIKNIELKESNIINICDIGYQKNIGYIENEKNERIPVFHLIIGVRESTSKLLEKRNIKFENGKEREIYIFPQNTLEVIMENYIGEANLIRFIGYIEVIPEDKLKLKNNFYSLDKLIDEIDIIKNNITNKKCQVCEIDQFQSRLYRCSQCKKSYYCSNLCQKVDKENHKEFCSK